MQSKLTVLLLTLMMLMTAAFTSPIYGSQRQSKSTVPVKICFTRGDWIYIANPRTGAESKLVKGDGPVLSPNGEWLAYYLNANYSRIDRIFVAQNRLTILNLRTKQELDTLREVPARSPRWSNDGNRLAFTLANSESGRVADLAVFDLRTSKWEKVSDGLKLNTEDQPIYLDSWAPDDRSLLFHTHRGLYEFQFEGRVLRRLPLSEPFEMSEVSSETTFSFSPDKQNILFDHIISSQVDIRLTVSIFNLSTNRITNISPKDIGAREPRWLPSGREFLFNRVVWRNKAWRDDVGRMSLDRAGFTILIKDARLSSYSTR